MTDFAAYFDAAADLLDLPVLPAHRDDAIAALMVIMAHAERVLSFPLPDAIEPAPRFIPC